MVSADAYLDARAAFERHDAEVKAFAGMLSRVAHALAQRPEQFSFADGPVTLPPRARMRTLAVSVDVNDWRSPQEIQALLNTWHAARSAMIEAWQALPQHWRRGVQPLPTIM